MEFLIVYAIIAVLSAVVGHFVLIVPVVRRLVDEGYENSVTESQYIFYVAGLIAMLLAAPLVLYVLYDYERIIQFRETLFKDLQ